MDTIITVCVAIECDQKILPLDLEVDACYTYKVIIIELWTILFIQLE